MRVARGGAAWRAFRRLTNGCEIRGFSRVGWLDWQRGFREWDQRNMAFADVLQAEKRGTRSIGRRQEDRALRGGSWEQARERRRPVARTDAAAQSVIMAGISGPTGAVPATHLQAAKAYEAVKPKKSAAEKEREAFLREAELAHQAAQRAWVFERRTGQKPRSANVEDAEFVDI